MSSGTGEVKVEEKKRHREELSEGSDEGVPRKKDETCRDSHANTIDSTSLKSSSHNVTNESPSLSAESEQKAIGSIDSTPKKVLKCPPALIRARDSLFQGLTWRQRSKIVIDAVAVFSVTESGMAEKMTATIKQIAEKVKPEDNVIFDGMACVGGNTISFAQSFRTVLSNEYDPSRYEMLCYNVKDVLEIQNVTFFNGSIIDLAFTEHYDVLFLDPEWGGPDYKHKSNVQLNISGVGVDAFCLRVLHGCARVHTVALKLPVNYDNNSLKQATEAAGFTYMLLTNYQKMTLTILQKPLKLEC